MANKRSYAIIGAGGVGCYLAWCLIRAGCDVHLLAHSDYAHIKTQGLRVDSYKWSFHVPTVQVYDTVAKMPPCDTICICLKTTENNLLATLLPPLIKPGSNIISMQNGIGTEEEIAVLFPKTDIRGGIWVIWSHKIGPGHISHTEVGRISFAPHTVRKSSIDTVYADFVAAGIETAKDDNLAFLRRKKLVRNIPFNWLSVILNATTDVLVNNQKLKEYIRAVMQEVVWLATADGCPLPQDIPEKTIELTETMWAYKPSMYLDYEQKRPVEVDALYTKPLARGKKNKYDTPLIQALAAQLAFLDQKNRKK